mgnify:CR=1 FL=1
MNLNDDVGAAMGRVLAGVPLLEDVRRVRRHNDMMAAGVPALYTRKILDAAPPTETWERPWVMLVGTKGTGKTHRACEIMLGEFIARRGREKERFVDWPQFILERKEAIGNPKAADPLRDVLETRHLLVLDDVGAERESEFATDSLNLILGRRYNDVLKTVLTTNLTMQEIGARYGERISSRMSEAAAIVPMMKAWRPA